MDAINDTKDTVEGAQVVSSKSFSFVDMDGTKVEYENEEEDSKPTSAAETWPKIEFSADEIKNDINKCDDVDIKEEPIEINVYKEEAACPSCHYSMEDGVSSLISNRSAIQTKDLTETLPKNFFQIESNVVYALRCIPADVVFGPYTGLESLRNNTGYIWILKGGGGGGGRKTELDNKHLYNWMRHVQFSARGDESEGNLSIFQSGGLLYYRCDRDIGCGERLVAHLDDRSLKDFANDTGKYYCPVELAVPHVYACITCCLGFNSEAHLREHLQRRHYCSTNNNTQTIPIEIVQCPLCKMVSSDKKDIRYHLRNNCGRNRKRISSLSMSTTTAINSNKSDSGDHISLHRCIVCDAVFKYKTNLKRHMNAHENGKEFRCYQCDYRTERKSYLKSHIISKHTGEYACHRCDFVAKRRTHLKLHKVSAHADVVAERKTATITDIDHIDRDRNNPKTTFCSNSSSGNDKDNRGDDEGSSSSSNNNNNVIGLKKYKCSMCNQELTERATLRRHVRAVHAGEKPYRCEHCDYRCASTGSLYKHTKIHTGEKPHVCRVCNWKFVEKCKLRRHMKVHTREKYPCDHCGHQARTIATLNKHIKRVHNNTCIMHT